MGDLTSFPNGILSMGVPVINSLGIGNVYHVVKSTESFYGDFDKNRKTRYSDGSQNLHTTIQAALDATVECRNDYVVVYPSNSDYDITAALTMSKKSVHLVCPAGLGYEIGANNSCRIEQTTAATAIIAVSDAAVEIAGFYLKPYIGIAHITFAATSYAPNVHHNYIPLKWTSSNAAAFAGSGDACAWGNIEKNYFISQSGNSQTCAAIITIGASATGANVSYNQFTIGDGNTATICISNGAVKGNTNFNIFSEAGGSGAVNGGTITKCYTIHVSGCAIGNRGAVSTGKMGSGGTTLKSYSENYGGYIANTGTTNGSVES
ncbi:hypothetical protein LCGC14_0711620 [marine sediment metagenome]|uniref:Uncharacterized protein n=1 Tax=marine sediment metagenome TaxID=412755 RepID=A0A0F9R0C2_9ZZZZ